MKKFLSRHGEIYYSIQGDGPRHILLVHNSGGSHEMMHYTASHFSKTGTTLAPDLLGHGASDKPKIEYSIELFAENLIELCRHESWRDIIFIGLNYGADIGIEIAKRSPHLISRLILIEPPFFMEPWIRELVEKQIQDLQNPKSTWAEDLVNAVLVKASPSDRAIGLKALQTVPPHVKGSTFKHLLEWDKKHEFRCFIPTLLIQASQPFCTEEKARSVFTDLQVGRVVRSGPWANLEVPTQVHSMIDRFLEI